MSLIYPMFAMVLLTYVVSVVMFRSRVRSVRSKDLPLGYFKTFESIPLPEYVAKPSRHYSNLFEAPTLFYVACLAAMIAQKQGPLILGLAWAYVFVRYLHAFIHIGSNVVLTRMRVFAVSMALLFCLWLAILI